MAYYWILNMGRSAKANDGGVPQTMYRFRGAGFPPRDAFGYERGNLQPTAPQHWEKVECSDPYGYDKGLTPDWLVGRYGNWWGAQWSAGRLRGFDGLGPTDYPFVDALDQIALHHDIECWIAGEQQHNPGLCIEKNDRFRAENVYRAGGQIEPHEFLFVDGTYPHTHAHGRVKMLPPLLKRRLKTSILLYTILQSESRSAGVASRVMSYRFDSVVKTTLLGIGLASVKVEVPQLLSCLKNPRADNIPISAADCDLIRDRIIKALQGRGDPRVAEILAMLDR